MSKYHSKSKHNIKCISKKYFQNLDKHLHFYAANILMKRDLAKFNGTLFCRQKTLPPSQLGYSVCVCGGGGVFFMQSMLSRKGTLFRLRSIFYCFQICPVLIFSHVVKERCMYVEPCAPEHTYISLVLSISISTVTVIYVPHSVSVFHNVFFIRICVN